MAVKPDDPIPKVDTMTFGPFTLGMNNIDRSLSMGDNELVLASNVDVNHAGILTRRPGSTLVISALGCHSIWQRDTNTAFYASGTDLNILRDDGAGAISHSAVISGLLQYGRTVSYVMVNDEVYCSNGVINRKFRADNTAHPWGVELPPVNPTLSLGAGNLPGGRYLVGIQFIDDLGEASGMRLPLAIQMPDGGGGISIGNIPSAASQDVKFVSIYVSEQNGAELFRYGDYAIGTSTVVVGASSTMAAGAKFVLDDVMPPLTTLEYYHGRVYGVDPTDPHIVWYSHPLAYGLYNRRTNLMLFDRPVGVIKAVDDGVYFGTDVAVHFYDGDGPENFKRRIALPYGAVPGTGITYPKSGIIMGAMIRQKAGLAVGWLSERGYVKAHMSGRVEPGDKERVTVGMYAAGASFYREKDNIRQVVSMMQGETRSAMVSKDYAEAEVRRNGVLV